MSNAKIKKMTIHYGTITDEQRDDIGAKFDLLDTGTTNVSDINYIKTNINPDFKAIRYMDISLTRDYDPGYTNGEEWWFIHDNQGNDSTHRIYSDAYPTYDCFFMQPDPSGNGSYGGADYPSSWAYYYISTASHLINNGTTWDGIFADDFWKWLDRDSIDSVHFNNMNSEALGAIPRDWDDWRTKDLDCRASSMAKFIYSAQTFLDDNCPEGRTMIMVNCWKWTQLHIIPFDKSTKKVAFWEGFMHSRAYNGYNMGYGSGYNYGKLAIDLLHNIALSGQEIAVEPGCDYNNNYPDLIPRWQDFTLGCFLMAVVDLSKSYYCWGFYYDQGGYFDKMDYDFGEPVDETYTTEPSTDTMVLTREFDNYYIGVNLSTTKNYTVTLGGESTYMISRNAYFISKETPTTQIGFHGSGRMRFYNGGNPMSFITG